MKLDEIMTFVKNFNQMQSISFDDVVKGLNLLNKDEHELFMLLVNYKNGKDFMQKLNNGEV